MQKFVSRKIVEAAKIDLVSPTYVADDQRRTLIDATIASGKHFTFDVVPGKTGPQAGDYIVRYSDGYVSWSPAKAFEEGYTSADTMNFGDALQALKEGRLVARRGWNGKAMFVFLVQGSQFKVNRAPLLGIFPEGTEIDYRPHIDIRHPDGKIGTWAPSNGDALAEDWYIVE